MKKSELRQIIKEEISKVLKENKLKFKKDLTVSNPDGIYILNGGLNPGGDGWTEKSMGKANILYYTTKFNDPKLDSEEYTKDGMVKVEVKDGDIYDVASY